MGQGPYTRDARARRLLPAHRGMLRQAQPAAPYGAHRHQSTSALKTTGTHELRENNTPGHKITFRAHNQRACYIQGQEV